MVLNTPGISWRSCTSWNMYSGSSQLPGRLTQRVDLWNTPCSQTLRHHARIGSVKTSINSSHLQSIVSLRWQLQCRLSTRSHIHNLKSDKLSHHKFASISWSLGSMPRKIGGIASGLGFAVSGMANAEGPVDNNIDTTQPAESSANLSHGKKVYTDYSVTGIPGDGRCLFRSVAHGACIRSGKPIPDENLQRKLADELRTMVADEFIKRRAETEWFIEGDFDTYVSQIRKPHVWGGEPELLMASHVLQMPISVYMHDKKAGRLIAIAEYGQEYGTEAPVQVLYHGYGHYEALQIPGNGGPRQQHRHQVEIHTAVLLWRRRIWHRPGSWQRNGDLHPLSYTFQLPSLVHCLLVVIQCSHRGKVGCRRLPSMSCYIGANSHIELLYLFLVKYCRQLA